ncbi:MAG: 1-acyl-sn-glycerol-3-phosphate acyltransferase [Myxococcota bacterium]
MTDPVVRVAPPPDPPPERFGASMARAFGPLYRAIGLGRGLDHVRLPDHAAEVIRAAALRGPVVYVLPRCSSLDHLALNAALAARRLPLSVWAPGVSTAHWLPLSGAWASLTHRAGEAARGRFAPDPVSTGWVASALAAGHAITWFVDERPGWFGPRPARFDPLAEAAELDPPVQVIPLMIVWDRSPDHTDPIEQFFRGKQGVPGWARRWWRAMRSGDVFVQVGPPVELRTLAERVGKERLAGVLRRMISRNLHDERKLVAGPRLLPYQTLKKVVLDNPPMRDFAKAEAAQSGFSIARVERQMSREYDRIAANFSWTVIQLLHLVLRPLWTRVFSGVDARPEDIERVRAAMRDGAVVFAPCHKSHFDYVLMSWVMYDHDLIVPHVVAGMNLAIWPISVLLRGAGGFFVKRAFAGDRVFPVVFARYLRELVLREYPIEFFIEGGRTRTGRLLPPRAGVLSMVLDAAEVRAHGRAVTLLPISLAYEQVAEEGAYAREMGGEKKKAESLGELLKARAVLRRRFGRVYLRVGEPVSVGAFVDEAEGRPAWSARPAEQRKAEVMAMGRGIVAEIGRQMVLLPTSLVSLALLSIPRRAVSAVELTARIGRFDALLASVGVKRAQSLARFDQGVAQALDRLVRDGRIVAHQVRGERVWAIEPEHRVVLDFYKNQVLHFLAAPALVAVALRSLPDGPVDPAALEQRVGQLVALFRRELVLVDGPARITRSGVELLVAHGAIREDPITVVDVVRIAEIHGLFRPIVEAYAAAIRAPVYPLEPAGVPAAIQRIQGALVSAGVVSCPESLVTGTLHNAVTTWVEDGVLVNQDGRLAPSPSAADWSAVLWPREVPG